MNSTISILRFFVPLLFVCVGASLVHAEKGWATGVAGAWQIDKAYVVDGKEDPAAVGNMALLIGQRLYLAVDRNTANEHDYSASPVIRDKGFEIYAISQEGQTVIALAKHKTGKRRFTLTTSDNQPKKRLALKIAFADRDPVRYVLQLDLIEIDQATAKNRTKRILREGEFAGSPQSLDEVRSWTTHAK